MNGFNPRQATRAFIRQLFQLNVQNPGGVSTGNSGVAFSKARLSSIFHILMWFEAIISFAIDQSVLVFFLRVLHVIIIHSMKTRFGPYSTVGIIFLLNFVMWILEVSLWVLWTGPIISALSTIYPATAGATWARIVVYFFANMLVDFMLMDDVDELEGVSGVSGSPAVSRYAIHRSSTSDEESSSTDEDDRIIRPTPSTIGLDRLKILERRKEQRHRRRHLCEKFDPQQRTTILDAPDDALLLTFSFLRLKDIIAVGQVCEYWKFLHRNDRLWKRLCVATFGSLEYDSRDLKANLRKLKFRRGEWKNREEMTEKDYLARRKPHSSSKKARKRLAHRARCFRYWTLFRRRMRIYEQEGIWARKNRKLEQVLEQYTRLFASPIVWTDCFSLSYLPIMFVMLIVFSILCLLYFIDVFPQDIFIDDGKKKLMFLVVGMPGLLVIVLYCAALICALLNALFSAVVNYDNMDCSRSMLFVGLLFLPVMFFLFSVKFCLLPETVSWSAALSPLYIIMLLVHLIALLLQWRVRVMKWEKLQKGVWAVSFFLNVLACWTVIMLCIHLDNDLQIDNRLTGFVLIPVWIFCIAICCAVPIGAVVIAFYFNWRTSLLLYAPPAFSFFFLCLFFVLFGLCLDEIVQPSVGLWAVVFGFLLLWEVIWGLISLGFALAKTIIGCAKLVLLRRSRRQRARAERNRRV